MSRFNYTITKTFPHSLGLSCVYRQAKAGSHCRHLHGYALEFEITIGAHRLDECGWVYDFGNFKHVKEWLQSQFDHTLLVAHDDPHIHILTSLADDVVDLANVITLPTIGAEAFATHVLRYMEILLKNVDNDPRKSQPEVVSVTCREHQGNSATVHAPLYNTQHPRASIPTRVDKDEAEEE